VRSKGRTSLEGPVPIGKQFQGPSTGHPEECHDPTELVSYKQLSLASIIIISEIAISLYYFDFELLFLSIRIQLPFKFYPKFNPFFSLTFEFFIRPVYCFE